MSTKILTNVGATGYRPAEVLLVEDNLSDVILTQESFKSGKMLVNLHHVENGEECMAFLNKEGPYADVPTPDLILLDLNMPRMGGREVLAAMVASETLRHLPVVVLTTSASEKDVLQLYQLRCSSYIVKPVEFDNFQQVIRQIGEYWFALVALPSTAATPGPGTENTGSR